MVVLIESGADISRTRSSVECTFARRFHTYWQTCSVVSTLDSNLAGSAILFIAPNLAATSRNTKLYQQKETTLADFRLDKG
jgi:hypothetical protein